MQKTKPKLKPTVSLRNAHMCVYHCAQQNSSDTFSSYPSDNHHSSDDVQSTLAIQSIKCINKFKFSQNIYNFSIH